MAPRPSPAPTSPPTRDLRRALLDAAAELIAEQGPGAVSLREIARRCGVSHAAPAHHFGDRAGLLAALAAEGFRGLADALAAVEAATGRERLVAQGRAYVAYATASPGRFPVMFRTELCDQTSEELLAARTEAFAALEGAVRDAQAEGWAPAAGHDAAVLTAWASVHGLATLWMDGGLPPHLAAGSVSDLATAVAALIGSAGGAPPSGGRRRQAGSRRETAPPMETT